MKLVPYRAHATKYVTSALARQALNRAREHFRFLEGVAFKRVEAGSRWYVVCHHSDALGFVSEASE